MWYRPGLEKSEIQLALWDWIEMWLGWGFAQWESEQEEKLARQRNLTAPGD